MSDETQGQGPAPAATSPPPGAAPDGAQSGAGGATSAPAATEPSAAPAKPNDGIQSRFDELTRFRRDAERRADYWENQARSQQRREEPQPAKPEAVKTLEDFEYDTAKYTQYLVELSAKNATEAAKKELREEQERAQVQKREADWATRRDAFAKDVPDFRDVVSREDVPVNQAMISAIQEADDGPAILYHLGKNPQVAAQIARLGPVAAAMELGRISATITAAKAAAAAAKPTVSQAPPPTPKIEAGDAKVEKDPSEMTDNEFSKWRRKQIAARGR